MNMISVSCTAVSGEPGHGVWSAAGSQSFAAPGVVLPVVMNTPVPSGHRPELGTM